MSTISFENIREELEHTLRNGDILTTAIRGVTTTTDTFTATAGQTAFTLPHTPIRNIRSVVVNSVTKKFIKDWDCNWATGVVTLGTGAGVGESVVINYDYGAGDKIYRDMPRVDLTLSSFPRVGIELTSSRTEPLGLGGMTHITDMLVTIYAWVPANKDTNVSSGFGATEDLETLLSSIRGVIRTNAKSFYTFPYITPAGSSPIIKGTNDKIIQRSQDFNIRFIVE